MSEVEEQLSAAFVCSKCKASVAHIERLAMSGTGISRILDIQPYSYFFVSCNNCGYTETYKADILSGKKDKLGDVLDILFALD